MIWFITTFLLLQLAAGDQVSQYFKDRKEINTVEGLKCSKLEGSAKDCLACYPCDHERIKKAKEKLQALTFTYSNCTKDDLCCIKTNDLRARTNDDNCGKHNPEGNPRKRRPSLRSVLEREYPWRAWVYKSTNEQPLCAASYIFFGVNALLTTASCVSGYQPSDLLVKFTKTQGKPDSVTNIVIHESFSKSKGGNSNDIALLTLSVKPDSRVQPVCLDKDPALIGAPCALVSDSETYVNAIIPLIKRCQNDSVSVENGVMCTYRVKGDYTPQRGAGLYCINEHSSTPTYTLYGIYQDDHSTNRLSIYTSVHNYTNWILKTTNAIKKSKRN